MRGLIFEMVNRDELIFLFIHITVYFQVLFVKSDDTIKEVSMTSERRIVRLYLALFQNRVRKNLQKVRHRLNRVHHINEYTCILSSSSFTRT